MQYGNRLAILLALVGWQLQGGRAVGQFAFYPIGNPQSGQAAITHERADLSGDAQQHAAGTNRFALDLYRMLAGKTAGESNLLISPYSISSALGMTYAGARGRTAEQMADVLGFNLPDERLHPAAGELMRDLDAAREGYTLSVANRLFAQQGFPFNDPFLNITRDHYSAPVEPLDFVNDRENSRIRINDWVAEQTNNRILDLLPQGSVNDRTRLVLTNAIHFDGMWKYEFDEAATHAAPFYGFDRQATSVDMMYQLQTYNYGKFDGFQMLEMPYAGDDLSMVFMLPDAADGLPDFEASLNPEMLEQSLDSLRQQQVHAYLPKYKFDASFGLAGTLRDMGMTDAFGNADFSGIAAGGGLSISDVLHKAFIDVNEAGTEAAAATAVIVALTSASIGTPPTPPVFRADHPFVFALRDTHSGSLLFMGRVAQPGEATVAGALRAVVPEPASLLMLIGGVLALTMARTYSMVESRRSR